MLEAISKLDVTPDFVLTDAMPLPMDNSKAIIHGDALSLSIAAASVLAKVTRDEIMYELDKKYPEYGFKSHKGYPTKKTSCRHCRTWHYSLPSHDVQSVGRWPADFELLKSLCFILHTFSTFFCRISTILLRITVKLFRLG